MKTLQVTDKEEIEKIIANCDVCYVGMAEPDGTPYVIPMNFGYEDGIIYLHSAPEGRSIAMLGRNSKVCITFSRGHKLAFQHPQVACSYRMKAQSVIVWGNVVFIEDNNQKIDALNIIMKQYSDKEFTYSEPAVANVKVWVVKIDHMTCKEFGAPHK